MAKLYEWHSNEYEQSITSSNKVVDGLNMGNHFPHKARIVAFRLHLRQKDIIKAKNELESYLNEVCIDEDDNYDVLAWWKLNEFRFLVLQR